MVFLQTLHNSSVSWSITPLYIFSWNFTPSPVIETHKIFESRENSCFKFLYEPITSRKILVQTTQWSTSPKISDFQNDGKSPWCPFSYVGPKFKCLPLIYRWKGNFIRINIVIKTRIQKCTYFQLLTENRRDIFLKVVGFLLKIVNIRKNDITKPQLLFN